MYIITVEATYKGYDLSKDAQIRKVAGRVDDGSGYGLGVRDIGFSFRHITAAHRAAKRFRKIKGVRASVRVVHSDE